VLAQDNPTFPENNKKSPATRAIETIEMIDVRHHLVLDETLPIAGPTRVRVSHLLPEDSDINETEWLQAAVANPAFNFLKYPKEDIYALSEGRLFYGFDWQDHKTHNRGKNQWKP